MKKLILFFFGLLVANEAFAQCPVNTVPHHEGFLSIGSANQLPPCWMATNLGSSSLTFTNTGSPGNHGGFSDQNPGDNFFFSPAFLLWPGVTYSVSIWYRVSSATNAFSDLTLLSGPNQGTLGLQTLTTTVGAPTAAVYSVLSATLTVSASGSYYFAIKCGSQGTGSPQHLFWDDFSITIPCALNTPTVTVVTTHSAVCAGDTVTLQASGAHIYAWAGSAKGSSLSVTPTVSSTFTTVGTDTLSKCSATVQTFLTVYENPMLIAGASHSQVCAGMPVTLSAYGTAQTYSWNFGHIGSTVNTTQSVSTVYTLTGITQHGCVRTGTVNVGVLPAGTMTATADRTIICAGEKITLSAEGFNSYTWQYSNGVANGNIVTLMPVASTVYTVTGSGGVQCDGTSTVYVAVSECLGVDEALPLTLVLYPNPVIERLEIRGVGENSSISIYDLRGRELFMPLEWREGKWEVNMRDCEAGLYFVIVSDGNRSACVRILSQSPW